MSFTWFGVGSFLIFCISSKPSLKFAYFIFIKPFSPIPYKSASTCSCNKGNFRVPYSSLSLLMMKSINLELQFCSFETQYFYLAFSITLPNISYLCFSILSCQALSASSFACSIISISIFALISSSQRRSRRDFLTINYIQPFSSTIYDPATSALRCFQSH